MNKENIKKWLSSLKVGDLAVSNYVFPDGNINVTRKIEKVTKTIIDVGDVCVFSRLTGKGLKEKYYHKDYISKPTNKDIKEYRYNIKMNEAMDIFNRWYNLDNLKIRDIDEVVAILKKDIFYSERKEK